MKLAQQREEIVREHMETEARHAFDETLKTFAEPRYEVVPGAEVYDGADEVMAFYREADVAFPDFHFDNTVIHHAGEAVIVEVDFVATHLGAYRGLPATGRPLRYRMCNLFLFRGADLICERLYFDRLTILEQLGIGRDPTSPMGRIMTFLNHPITVAKAFLRR
jgi:steroid delta-isomerase-like uncharacterized protein